MGELYYSNTNFWFDEKRGKYRGRAWHYNSEGKRTSKNTTLKADKPRAAKQEFNEWCNRIEKEAAALEGVGESLEISSRLIPDYVAEYVTAKETTKAIEASTIHSYETSLSYIRSEFAGVKVADLTSKDVEAWLTKLTNAGYSQSTIGKGYRLLKQVMNDAVSSGAILRNPLDTVKPPKRGNKKQGINALDAAGCKRLLAKMAGLEPTPTLIAAYIAIYSGMRRAEICGLKWRDIDEKGRVIWVRRSIGVGKGGTYKKLPKTDKIRDAVLPDTLAKILLNWKASQRKTFANVGATLTVDSYIIGDADGYFSPERVSKEWTALARLFGVKGTEGRTATFHDLRHTWATLANANGVDIKTISSNLGHANAAMTLNIYASADPEAKKRAADITENLLGFSVASTGNSGNQSEQ